MNRDADAAIAGPDGSAPPAAVRTPQPSEAPGDAAPAPRTSQRIRIGTDQRLRPLRLHIAALTHQGQVRSHNEDSLFAGEGERLAVVCDGMGGHAGGHVASEVAVQVVTSAMRSLPSADWQSEERIIEALKQAVFAANDHILSRARQDPALHDMGTTLVACAYLADRVVTANIGDSRIYRIAGGKIEQISEDHSLVAERVREGLLDPDSDEAQMLANIVTRALGMDQVTVDMTVEELRCGDTYLLCSDGLCDMVSDAELLQLVALASDPHHACALLVELANQRGGYDNISVVIVRVM